MAFVVVAAVPARIHTAAGGRLFHLYHYRVFGREVAHCLEQLADWV